MIRIKNFIKMFGIADFLKNKTGKNVHKHDLCYEQKITETILI